MDKFKILAICGMLSPLLYTVSMDTGRYYCSRLQSYPRRCQLSLCRRCLQKMVFPVYVSCWQRFVVPFLYRIPLGYERRQRIHGWPYFLHYQFVFRRCCCLLLSSGRRWGDHNLAGENAPHSHRGIGGASIAGDGIDVLSIEIHRGLESLCPILTRICSTFIDSGGNNGSLYRQQIFGPG